MSREFVRAGRFWSWALPRLGGHAITMPWGRVYLLPHVFDSERTRFHESIHLEQIKRDGALKFSVLYLWYCVKFGYWGNPYEIEAYTRENERYAGTTPTRAA